MPCIGCLYHICALKPNYQLINKYILNLHFVAAGGHLPFSNKSASGDGRFIVCVLIQAAAIHLEKVARREIGTFTTPKDKTRSKPLAPPPSGKEPEAGYMRVPISYTILDSVGHCFQVKYAYV